VLPHVSKKPLAAILNVTQSIIAIFTPMETRSFRKSMVYMKMGDNILSDSSATLAEKEYSDNIR